MTALQEWTTQSEDHLDTKALSAGFVAPLTYLGLLSLSGNDAVSFLHRQLSNDVEHLRSAQARLAGYCTPQGRLLATLLMWKTDSGILLQMPQEILPSIQKRLKMFVLRDKVAIADVTDGAMLLGLGGNAAGKALSAWFSQLPSAPYNRIENENGTLIRVADSFGAPRYEWIMLPETGGKIWPAISSILKPASARAWRLAEIDAGIPQITAPTQERFIPQMLNFDLVGGVSFKKGCYPGQEVVARTQYLGKTRRRMLAATFDLPAGHPQTLAGVEVYSDANPTQPCGMIVNAEPAGANRIDSLVSLRLDDLAAGTVHFGSASGPALRFTPLPYVLPEENPET